MTSILKRGKERHRRGRPCEDGGRDQGNATTAKNRQQLQTGEEREDSPQSLWSKHSPADASILALWPPELGGNKLLLF